MGTKHLLLENPKKVSPLHYLKKKMQVKLLQGKAAQTR